MTNFSPKDSDIAQFKKDVKKIKNALTWVTNKRSLRYWLSSSHEKEVAHQILKTLDKILINNIDFNQFNYTDNIPHSVSQEEAVRGELLHQLQILQRDGVFPQNNNLATSLKKLVDVVTKKIGLLSNQKAEEDRIYREAIQGQDELFRQATSSFRKIYIQAIKEEANQAPRDIEQQAGVKQEGDQQKMVQQEREERSAISAQSMLSEKGINKKAEEANTFQEKAMLSETSQLDESVDLKETLEKLIQCSPILAQELALYINDPALMSGKIHFDPAIDSKQLFINIKEKILDLTTQINTLSQEIEHHQELYRALQADLTSTEDGAKALLKSDNSKTGLANRFKASLRNEDPKIFLENCSKNMLFKVRHLMHQKLTLIKEIRASLDPVLKKLETYRSTSPGPRMG